MIFPYVICRRDERICLTDWLCVCVSKTNSNFSYSPSKIGWADFSRILHNNSTPRRNHTFWAAFEYLYPFCIYGGSNFPFFHILWSWLLTLRIALPCICVMKTWLADVICFDICLLRDFSCNVILRIVVVFFVRTHTVFISFLKGLCLVSYQNLMHCLVAGNHILLFCKLVESHFKVL